MSSENGLTGSQAKRRAQAIGGAFAGLAVIVVLFAVFFSVKNDKSDKTEVPAAAASAAVPPPAATESPAADPSEDPAAASPAPAENVSTPAGLTKQPTVKAGTGTVSKLRVTALVKGTGPVVKAGQTITTNYVVVTYKDGKVMDSSWSRGQTFATPIGTGQVIKGWDQAIPGQKVGSRLQIDVPAALAYGAQQGDLRFVVDILAAK